MIDLRKEFPDGNGFQNIPHHIHISKEPGKPSTFMVFKWAYHAWQKDDTQGNLLLDRELMHENFQSKLGELAKRFKMWCKKLFWVNALARENIEVQGAIEPRAILA